MVLLFLRVLGSLFRALYAYHVCLCVFERDESESGRGRERERDRETAETAKKEQGKRRRRVFLVERKCDNRTSPTTNSVINPGLYRHWMLLFYLFFWTESTL